MNISCSGAKVKPLISVLPNDYNILENKPTINGIVLQGEVDVSSLNLLSGAAADYNEISIVPGESDSLHVIVLGGEKPQTIRLGEILSKVNSFTTTKDIIPDANIGSYQFVEKKI